MRFKLFEEFVNEGINDPGILKAFFMAGGPGSGKSYVASELFGFPKAATSSVSYATGLKLVNNDNAFEKAIKDAGYDIGKLADYAKDPEVWSKVMAIRDKAKGLTRRMQGNYISGRLGQVIDGTGKDFKKIAGMRKMYADLGYDTYMVFVNTSLETALERNRMRPRKLDDGMVEKMWKAVQDNLGKFQKEFGSVNMIIVDNNATDDEEGILDQIEKQIMKRIKDPVNNVLGKRWISDNSPENRNKNQPFGVSESLNEGLKITAKMPATMKKFINDLAKDRPNTWSNELTDLANSIIGAHREYDLDLADSDKVGPQYINIRELPVSELTPRSIDMINKLWNDMGDQAKETIYDDYSHWFRVSKKDRPLYGMYESAVNEAKVTKKDFDKVVKVLSKSKYPFTIMLVPKWNEIDIITGQDSPDDIGDDIIKRLDSAGLNWGGNSGITISGDSSNYSRREYDEIAKINGGHKHY
jgi:predicted kinase